MVDSPKSKLTSTSGDWTSCPYNIFESQVVWKTFRSSLAGENLLLELYSPYRPQHRTHLVVPWLQLHGPKTGPWKRWVGTIFESISCKFGGVYHGLPMFAIFLVYHDFLQPRVAGVGFGGRGAGKCDHLEGVEMVGLASSSGVEICR